MPEAAVRASTIDRFSPAGKAGGTAMDGTSTEEIAAGAMPASIMSAGTRWKKSTGYGASLPANANSPRNSAAEPLFLIARTDLNPGRRRLARPPGRGAT